MILRKHRNSFEPLKTPHTKTHHKGSQIFSVAEFKLWCMSGYPIYFNHKFMHFGFATSMSFRTVCQAIAEGHIRRAVKINA